MSVTDVVSPSSPQTECYETASRQPEPEAWALPGFLINCDFHPTRVRRRYRAP
jgi:hypothetical protein